MKNTSIQFANGDDIRNYLALKADKLTTYSKTEVDAMIAAVAGGGAQAVIVETIAARDALDPKPGLVWVQDASADPTVTRGAAMYLWNAVSEVWIKTAETESMDVTITWDLVQNKPANLTLLGNTTNAANGLVVLSATSQYPAFNGALITGLNASNIGSGTVGTAYLPIASSSAKGIASFSDSHFTVTSGNVEIRTATTSTLGIVKIGTNLSIDGTGSVSVPAATLAVAGVTKLGGATLAATPADDVAATEAAVKAAIDAVEVDLATYTTAGIASFNSAQFTVSSGAVSIKSGTTSTAGIVKLGGTAMGNAADVAATELAVQNYVTANSLSSVAVGSGLSGAGTAGSPITLDLSAYTTASAAITATNTLTITNPAAYIGFNTNSGLQLESRGVGGITIANKGAGNLQWQVASLDKLKLSTDGGTSFASPNTANGFVVALPSGKIDASLLEFASAADMSTGTSTTLLVNPKLVKDYVNSISSGLTSVTVASNGGLTGDGTTEAPMAIDLSNYSTGIIKLTGTTSLDLIGSDANVITIGRATHGVQVGASGSSGGVYINSLQAVAITGTNISLTPTSSSGRIDIGGTQPSKQGIVQIGVSSLANLRLAVNSTTGAAANTAGGLVVLGADGKIDPSLYVAGGSITVATTNSGLTGDGSTANPLKLDLSDYSETTLSLKGDSGELYGDPTGFGLKQGSVYVNLPTAGGLDIRTPVDELLLNQHPSNTAGGFAVVGSDGKLPSAIVPATTYNTMTIQQSTFATADAAYGGKYYELSGICDVTISDADGYEVHFDIKYDYANKKTRVYIPDSLPAGTISNWTLVYGAKTVA